MARWTGWAAASRHAYLTPGFPVTALVFLGLVAMLLLMLVVSRPVQALAGTAIVLLGLPVYAVIERKAWSARSLKPEA